MSKTEKNLVYEDFSALTKKTFVVLVENKELELELTEVKQLNAGMREGGAFSLLFSGGTSDPLPQASYRFENDVLGHFHIFIVPLGPDNGRMLYEAVFT